MSSWGDKLCSCSSLVLSSQPSQPLPDMGLLTDLGPKMALEKAHGSGKASLHDSCNLTMPSQGGNHSGKEVCSWDGAVISYTQVLSTSH